MSNTSSEVRATLALRVLCALLSGTWSGAVLSGAALPVPCVGTSCGTNASGFVSSGSATAAQSGNKLTVNQTSNNAALNWSSFNIGAGGKVVFQQPSSTAVALNRIFDSNPSSIFGALTANGQIYLINANGFLFGPTSSVNVAGLLASSLNITDATFAAGLLAPSAAQQPALIPFTDTNNNPVVNTGNILVQQGAQLVAADGGRLLLAAPTVQNAGSLSAPDGQIILAAGQTVFLQASGSASLRGLIVEVDGNGTAANLLTGQLSAARGNITLTGLMVNQDGRISATTSVAANGSVVLEAANTVKFDNKGNLTAAQGGQVDIGPDSVIEILPEYSDTATAVDAQVQLQSNVAITGQQVLMHGGSIDAPSGQLTVTAVANPSIGAQSSDNPDSKIRIDAGTSIDLAGSSAELPMAANLVTVQLRSNELANDPTQRNGALRGQTVVVDLRADGGAGTPIADVASAIAAVGKNIAQRTEAGGTASFVSEGDVVFNSGASINVSGGATTYLGGTIQTTALVGANGQLYDIGSANPLQAYAGVVNPTLTQTYDKWGVQEVVPTPGLSHYESGYQQGAPAGTIQFAGRSLFMDGALKGTAVNGPYQRGPVGTVANGAVPFGDAVPGATLVIGEPAGVSVGSNGQVDYLAPAVAVASSPTPVTVADEGSLPPQTLQLPAAYLTSDGFTNFQIFSNTTFSLPAGLPLQLPSGASLSVGAARLDIDSSITAPGGNLKFVSELTSSELNDNSDPTLGPGNSRAGIGVGDGVTLDVNGQWTNDSILAGGLGSSPTLQNGGAIGLQLTQAGSELVLGDSVSLLANGGAWVQASGTITGGNGGAISLDASPTQSAIQFGQNFVVQAFGVQTAAGGSFALSAPRFDISQGNGLNWTIAQRVDDLNDPGNALTLYAPLFSSNGFSSISLTATGAPQVTTGMQPYSNADDVLTVEAGTVIAAQTRSLRLNPGYQTITSGGDVAAFTQPVTLPLYSRPLTDVSLSVPAHTDAGVAGATNYGAIDLQTDAAISVDPGASINITGTGSIFIAGVIRAPGGSVTVQTVSPGTASPFDPGYLPDQGITLASTGVIDVSGGAAVLMPDTQGLLIGSVRSGGSVNLTALRGSLTLASGSLIDISGSSATLDIANPGVDGGYTREVLATSAGSLTLGSVESIDVLGTILGKAGVGTSGAAAGGSLTVDLTRAEPIAGQPDPFGLPMEIDVLGDAGNAAADSRVNLTTLGVAQIAAMGIDSLTLNAGGLTPGNIIIDTASPLSLGRQLTLESQSIAVAGGFAASLTAPSVTIENLETQGAAGQAPAPVYGNGTLSVAAQQLVVAGNVTLQNVAAATLTSQGDVQLEGTAAQPGRETGSLVTAGNLTIDAARIYPDTFTSFSVQSQSLGNPASGTVTLGQTAASLGSPLSGGGAVTITADTIVVGGSLYAPFGQIALTANKSLTIADGGLVSVSGTGLDVPFGQTEENGGQWIYQTPEGAATVVTGAPTKAVTLTAPSITVAGKATIDLTGGGDLYAYEWVPGTGGLNDSLSASVLAGGVAGLYAILPSMRGQAAPYDPQESGPSGSSVQTVYLTGGAGLAAGYYSLLPPRYALEPGALLVNIEPNFVSTKPGQIGALADGTPVLAGYLSAGTTGLHTGSTEYEGFAIYPGSYAQNLAAYNISDASRYFSAIAALAGTGPVAQPADAGSLTFSVMQSLNNSFTLEGSVLTEAAGGGRGALVNISAPNLEITSGNGGASTGTIAVSGSVLQSWNASALTLGGSLFSEVPTTTTTATGGTVASNSVTVAADTVTVDSGVQLTADQILVVAQQAIDLKSGSSLSSTSGNKGIALTALPTLEMLSLTDGANHPVPQAALLAVSDLVLPVADRAGAGAGGTIDLEKGATLKSGGALAVDAPGTITVAGAISGKGASWSLSSNSVGFVGGGTSADTLNIDSALAAALQQAGAVRISSQGSIDLFAPVTLGAATVGSAPFLKSLTLLGSSIDGQAVGDTLFGAVNLMLGGVNGAPESPVRGAGTLSFVADTVTLGPETLAVSGFALTLLQVAGAVESSGLGGLTAAGDLTINAVQVTPGAAAQTTLAATGALTLGAPATLRAGTTRPTLVGGELSLSGGTVTDEGVISAPSGLVSVTATGGDLRLGSTAVIDVAGTLLQAVNRSAPSPGGSVALTATNDVTLDAGSLLSVAGELVAPAGSIDVSAGGVATLAGQLNGRAGVGGTGGSFMLDSGKLAGGLTPLAAALASGAFTNAVNIRAGIGDLDLASSGIIAANSIVLTADTGSVDIAGQLTATSGAQRGFISLSAGNSVELAATGQLHADAGSASGAAGEIDLNAICAACGITLAPGSVITAAGAAGTGELVLRAPALTAANDVAINVGGTGLGADVSSVGQVIVEPVMVFQTSGNTVNSDLPADIGIASAYLTSASATISGRLTSPSGTPISVQAGVELQDPTPGDNLLLNQTLDLSTYSNPTLSTGGAQPAQVINLNLRAAGSITIGADTAITDGFIDDFNTGYTALSNTRSASLSFVAGSDLHGANPLSVLKGSNAALTLSTSTNATDGTTDGVGPAVIRTGTGDLNLVAAGDVIFSAGTSAYTGGEAPANVPAPGVVVTVNNAQELQNFGTNGGTVRVSAGIDVVGSPVDAIANRDNGDYGVTGWLLRQGNAQTPAQYGINYAAFDWNLGALGGGDVSVTAGRNVTNLSAAAADTLVAAENTNNGKATVYGAGGGLAINAGGDIGSAQVYVADAIGTLLAGGGLTTTQSAPSNNLPVGSSIALGDSAVSAWARDGIQVDAIYNPTFVPQLQGTSTQSSGQYFTYGSESAVNLSSTTGTVTLELSAGNGTMATLVGSKTIIPDSSAFTVLPPNLNLTSLQSDIDFLGTANLFPSSTGQLNLFAGRDINGNGGGGVSMSDTDPTLLPTASQPQVRLSNLPTTVAGLAAFANVIHIGDTNPALVTAGRDIVELSLSLPKSADVVAGRDMLDLEYSGQNSSPSDITFIAAGRDIIYQPGVGDPFGVQLGGQGSLDVIAGRNINLGFGNGVTTVGNLLNADLPSAQGADVTIMVGYGTQGEDIPGFISAIVADSPKYQAQLVSYVEELTGTSALTYSQAASRFGTFSASQQSALTDDVFFNELLLSGHAANSSGGVGFTEGYNAIDALFPSSRSPSSPYFGDLTLTSSEIYTLSGGNISIIVPGGQIGVGLANPPANLPIKPASNLGIVAEGTGNVSIYSTGDVNVDESRIFTLGGGNILIWSTLGSIDAGNGSKSSLSVPPPQVLVSSDGTITLDFSGSLSGSGIRTIQTNPDTPPGNVDLDAPVGTVNAGDAGIGASGNINIAAAHVIGVDNINFGGTATGVPPEVSNLGVTLSGASSVASSANSSAESSSATAANSAKEVAPLAQTALSWLDVFVIGLGEENCKPDDIECLKRQKTASP